MILVLKPDNLRIIKYIHSGEIKTLKKCLKVKIFCIENNSWVEIFPIKPVRVWIFLVSFLIKSVTPLAKPLGITRIENQIEVLASTHAAPNGRSKLSSIKFFDLSFNLFLFYHPQIEIINFY